MTSTPVFLTSSLCLQHSKNQDEGENDIVLIPVYQHAHLFLIVYVVSAKESQFLVCDSSVDRERGCPMIFQV